MGAKVASRRLLSVVHLLSAVHLLNFADDYLPRRPSADRHGKDLAHDAFLVDQVRGRPIDELGLLSIEVGDQGEAPVETTRGLGEIFKSLVLLGNGDGHGIECLQLRSVFLQPNELPYAIRSPMSTVGGQDQVLLPNHVIDADHGSIRLRQAESS